MRWCQERLEQGYTYGPVREAKHHPDLVGWERLDDVARKKDRDAIRQLPSILSRAGFQIIRIKPGAKSIGR
jgi:ribulose bisphosphate carboxylase small subunit